MKNTARRDKLAINRAHWNEATEIHSRGNVYGSDDFKRGECQLFRIEVDELGDVNGKTLLHLQCHFGLDTLSWARRGATVTGIDFSPAAIALAKSISDETRVPGEFFCANLYDARTALDRPAGFDIVFTSYGVICWLPDLLEWAQIIAHFLKPGGTFYIAEAHPFARIFPMDADVKAESQRGKPMFEYSHDPAGTYWPPSSDYADESATTTTGEHEWKHSMSDVINALIAAGLRIESLYEYPLCPWKVIHDLEVVERFSASRAYYGFAKGKSTFPLMFTLRARKPYPREPT